MSLFRLILFLIIITISNTSLAQNNSNEKGVAVVELFTSEGCSSCPPAEKVMSKLHDEFKDACFLEFHVDYWNYLGWKDEYSNKAYSQRQQDYAQTFGIGSIYTPQAIINGSKEMVGSDNEKLRSTIEQYLKQKEAVNLELKAEAASKSVTVSYHAGSAEGLLNIALIRLHAQTNVKKGENSGKKLVHTNVVSAFKTISLEGKPGNITIELPEGLSPNDCHIIGYVQKKDGNEIIAAREVEIEGN
jgi:hypothetical protein